MPPPTPTPHPPPAPQAFCACWHNLLCLVILYMENKGPIIRLHECVGKSGPLLTKAQRLFVQTSEVRKGLEIPPKHSIVPSRIYEIKLCRLALHRYLDIYCFSMSSIQYYPLLYILFLRYIHLYNNIHSLQYSCIFYENVLMFGQLIF